MFISFQRGVRRNPSNPPPPPPPPPARPPPTPPPPPPGYGCGLTPLATSWDFLTKLWKSPSYVFTNLSRLAQHFCVHSALNLIFRNSLNWLHQSKWLSVDNIQFTNLNFFPTKCYMWLDTEFVFLVWYWHSYLRLDVDKSKPACVGHLIKTLHNDTYVSYWPSRTELLSLEMPSKHSSYNTLCQFPRREYSV